MEVSNLVLLLLFLQRSTGNFINQHCQSRNQSVLCYNFNLSHQETSEIQDQDFVLSRATNITFRSCDIGIVNVNFFSKFPNAERMSFTNVTLSLTPSNKLTNYRSSNHLPLKSLILASCTVSDLQRSNSLKWMRNLENILIYNVTLNDFFSVDNVLLMETIGLRTLNITNGNLEFKENVFGNFMNLKSLTLRNQRIFELNKDFLSRYYKLHTLDLSLNHLRIVPSVPKSVENLNLDGNQIEYIVQEDFNNMRSLKSLSLNKNKLKFFSQETFENLVNLRILNLADNEFNHFTENYVRSLKLLERLDLRGNFLKDLNFNNVKFLYYK